MTTTDVTTWLAAPPVPHANGHTLDLDPAAADIRDPEQTEQAGPDDDDPRYAARAAWLASARTGRPLSGAALGRAYGMSDRWGRERVAETREQHPDAAAAADRAARPARAETAARATGTTGTRTPATPGNRPVSSGSPLVSTSREPASHPLPAVVPPPPVVPVAVPLAGRAAVPLAVPVVPVPDAAPAAVPLAVPVVEAVEVTPQQRRRSAIAAALAMTPGLSISWWSFMIYLQAGGAPFWLAAMASASVDGIAIYAALYAAWFTDHGKSARLAKLATYAMVAASAFVNWMHATAMHWSIGLHVVLSVPSVGAAVALELALLRMRVVARSKREQRRQTRQSVKVDADLWLMHPLKVLKARRAEGAQRIAEAFGQQQH